MKRLLTALLTAGAAIVLTPAAHAWNPRTQEAVVITAVHVLSKESVMKLDKLEADVARGASAPMEDVRKIYPGLDTGRLRAIESEMSLLRAVRGRMIDPYFAYRLGMLGRLVAAYSAPLALDSSVYRDRYYADVAANIRQVPLKLERRRLVDPAPYFERMRRMADTRGDLIVQDYRDGLGFAGVARAALSDDYSRSVNAVADVWYTVVTGGALNAGVSDDQFHDYVANAIAYYVKRGNLNEIENSYRRLSELTPITPDLAKRIGDMFYDAGFYERAITEYSIVLLAEPARRDVVERIARYHMQVGEKMLADGQLQEAHDAFARALQVDPLHLEAEAKRLEAERLIADRDARLQAARRSIEEAADLEMRAEQATLRNRFADAVDALKKAAGLYDGVTDEFPAEYRAASTGLTNIDLRLRDLKSQLIQNAQSFSGAGSVFGMQQLALKDTRQYDREALHTLATKELVAEIGRLKEEYRTKVRFQ
ncbi:MAG: hypothetical protein GWP08_01410 [Nitrospiraceae bacterium]|nr:hypothetical protein [Nitrospiraceae bacterium]